MPYRQYPASTVIDRMADLTNPLQRRVRWVAMRRAAAARRLATAAKGAA